MMTFPNRKTVRPSGRDKFIDPLNHRGWLNYFAKIAPRFKYVRFVGLPSLKDHSNVLLESLYVPLHFSQHYVSPDEVEKAEWQTLNEMLSRQRHLVVLGDPGSGKSTMVNHIVTFFATLYRHYLSEDLGDLIPLPFVLRDFTIDRDITFNSLLDQFVAQPYWSDKLSLSNLLDVLERGQVLVLLDGLDEIGDVARRRTLRRAVLTDGMRRFPRCVWVMTSRIVGYEDVPFDTLAFSADEEEVRNDEVREKAAVYDAEAAIEPESLLPQRFYLLPFTKLKIQQFAQNWYALREADKVERKKGVESLLEAISASKSIERLAHTPNLLTMMALVHRAYAQLPSGRALLYDRIAEAYLESIDTVRGIRESSVPFNLQRRWLGRLAYRMQQERAAGTAVSELLIPAEQVETEIRRVVGEDTDARQELEYIARRSGLLLARKPGFYDFVHLSFQEYFAASYLCERLMGFTARESTQQELAALEDCSPWHETLVFVFEKLAEHEGASDWLFHHLFAQRAEIDEAWALLAAELLGDLHAGLSADNQELATGLIVQAAKKNYSLSLTERVRELRAEVWQKIFLPKLEDELHSSSSSNPGFLLFLQGLPRLDWQHLEALLANEPLANITAEDLVSILPIAMNSEGPVFEELICRLPISLWFDEVVLFGFRPISRLAQYKIPWALWKRREFLIWCSALQLLIDCLLAKLTLRTYLGKTDLEISSGFFDLMRLFKTDDYPQFALTASFIARIKILKRPEEFTMFLRYLSLWGSAIIEEYPGPLPFGSVYSGLNELAESVAEASARVLRIASFLILGRDEFEMPTLEKPPPALKSQQALFQHLAHLVLGRGSSETWRAIEKEVEVLRDPCWQAENLPFLEEGEMGEALRLLGLWRENEPPLFDSAWFADDHPASSYLNARPSEFRKMLDAALKTE